MKFDRKKIHSWSKINNTTTSTTYPETTEEILSILKYAKNNKKKISIMGHGCSHGDLFFYNNKNIVINTTKFNNILDFDYENQTIKVQSGASVLKVNNFLFDKKLVLSSVPSNYEITIGGAVSNNVFGKDSHLYGFFDKNIIEIEYIDNNLNIHSISIFQDPNKIKQFISSIGLLGFIISIKLKAKKLKSNILIKESKYYPSINFFLSNYKKDRILDKDFHTIKVNQFNKNFEVFAETYTFANNFNGDFSYIDLYKFKSFIFLNRSFKIKRFFYKHIKNTILKIFSYMPVRFLWKSLNLIGFYYFKKNKKKKVNYIHIMDLLHNNNFSDHNILLKNGFYSFQIMIDLKEAKHLIKKYFQMARKYKCESYLSTIKFLPKRNDFVYNYDKHIVIEIYSPRVQMNYRQKEFLNKIINFIILNKNQVIISKDNVLNKNQLTKIFTKIYDFKKIKKELDPDDFFYSSYYDRIK